MTAEKYSCTMWYLFLEIRLFCINGNHATKPSTVGHVISERHRESTFYFTEIVNIYSLRLGTLCQIVRSISQFSLELYIGF